MSSTSSGLLPALTAVALGASAVTYFVARAFFRQSDPREKAEEHPLKVTFDVVNFCFVIARVTLRRVFQEDCLRDCGSNTN